ncbi:hypothetical protein LCGC14_0443370 [marine sediment metagenome]|uniref:Uncharacterized protein n=1 Tax=marine sediment metagenome TaxID=412755 RepID=A0A0F9V6J0_9ZZZZ
MSDWPSATGTAEAWTHIATQVLSVAAAVVTFSGIAAAAAPRLRFYVYLVKDGTAAIPLLRLNNDSGANYFQQRLTADGAGVTAARVTGNTSYLLFWNLTVASNGHGLIVADIQKPVAGEVGRLTVRTAVTVAAGIALASGAAEWTNAADPINRVDVIAGTGNLDAGTRTVLEGAA